MNSRLFSRLLRAAAIAGASIVFLHAADDKLAARPPLKLEVSAKPIDRDAPDRVSYAPIVKKTAPSVVSVFSTKKIAGQDLSALMDDPLFRRFFEGQGQGKRNKQRNSRTPDRTQQGLGSGVIITSDGYVLTNNHVVEGADEVRVAVGEGRKDYKATVVGRDAKTDIAVLKIDATNLTPAVFGDSEQLQVGDLLLALGNPFGIGQSVSRGIVSALGRGGLGLEYYEDFIQTDAAINPGNSGGALVDVEGRLVGINTAILSSSGGFNGVGLAIPINLVRSIAEQIVNNGRVDRGFLGVMTQELTEELSVQFGAERGALIAEISPSSPAEKAGLKGGDVILKLNAVEIRDARHLALTTSQLAPDTEVTVAYLRDGKTESALAKLGRAPTDKLAAGERDSAAAKDEGVLNGVTVGEITPELREQFHVPANVKGAIVTDVEPDSPSGRQGLREGDVILELDRKPVRDVEEAIRMSEELKGPKTTVRIWREGRRSYLVIDETPGAKK